MNGFDKMVHGVDNNHNLKVKNRTSFCPYEIFELDPECKREVNAKPKAGRYKRNVNEKQPHIIRTHAQSIGKSGRNMEPIFFEKIFQFNYE